MGYIVRIHLNGTHVDCARKDGTSYDDPGIALHYFLRTVDSVKRGGHEFVYRYGSAAEVLLISGITHLEVISEDSI